jgi:hypothetical protein
MSENFMETDTEKTSTAPFVDILEKDLSKPENSLPASVVTDALRVLSRFRKSTVELEVPREIAREIASGKLFRDGGVVRDSAGKIRSLLKDPSKIGKLAKGSALMFALVDLAQSLLLNERLKQIQEQLQTVSDKVDSLMHSKLHSAFEEARQIPHYYNPADRRKRVHSALNNLSEAVPALQRLIVLTAEAFERKAPEGNPNAVSIFGSRSKARGEAMALAQKLKNQIHLLGSLLSLRAKLQEELLAFKAAEYTRVELSAINFAWVAFFEKNLEMGGPLRPWGGETNWFNYINQLSMESVDYRQKTGEMCDHFLLEIRQGSDLCLLEHSITKAIAPYVPTYQD